MMTFDELYKAIEEAEIITLYRHTNPDPDALGSQLGLKKIIKTKFPNKKVYALGHDSVGLSFMGQMDQASDEQVKRSLAIVLDTANTERIDDVRYETAEKLIKIDHHPRVDNYAELEIVDPDISSTSELIIEFIEKTNGKLEIDDVAATSLYTGIIGDTGRFLFDNTGALTYERAGFLKLMGAKTTEVAQLMGQVSLKQIKLEGYAYSQMKQEDFGTFYLFIPQTQLQELNLTAQDAHFLSGIFGKIKGAVAWAVFIEQPDKSFKVHLRSKGPSINELAQKYSGGGHAKASGASVYNTEEAERLIDDLVLVNQGYVKES